MTVRAMVMAAGAGTRLRPLTHTIPKPMVPIANRPVLEYTLLNLKKHGITDIVLNLHSYPETIRQYFKDGSSWGLRLHYSFEPTLLGTAGGVKKVEEFLKQGTFLVMSGDGLTTVDLTALLKFHKQRKSIGTMGLKPVDSRFDYGVTLTNKQDRITRFIEKPKWSDVFSNQVNTGIYVFEPEVLKYIPNGKPYDFGHDLWPLLLKRKKPVYGYPMSEYWCDVGNLSEYRRAQRDVLEGHVNIPFPMKPIKRGIWVDEGTRIHPAAKLHAPCLIGKGGIIGKGAVIGAYTLIGDHARIGERSEIHNSILWDHVQVASGVKLANCILGNGSKITETISIFEGAVMNVTDH